MTKKYEKYCKERREQLIHIMQEKHIAATVFEDTEGRRDTSIRYLTGHPGDAILIITAKGESILCPWDEHMAANMASVDKILPFTRFSRNPINAVKAILQKLHINDGSRIDISPEIPYPMFLRYVDALPGLNVLCREDGIHSAVIKLRATKDEYEIQCIKEAAIVTDMIVDKLEEGISHIEVRVCDINPFDRCGVSKEQIEFVIAFLFGCLVDRECNSYDYREIACNGLNAKQHAEVQSEMKNIVEHKHYAAAKNGVHDSHKDESPECPVHKFCQNPSHRSFPSQVSEMIYLGLPLLPSYIFAM